jgi:hypothetical protein
MPHLWKLTLWVLCLLVLVGCAGKRVTLNYTADPGFAKLTGAQAVTVFQFRDSRGSEGDNDPYRVGGIYGGYGNRLSKVMADMPWQQTLVNALTTGLRARGVDAIAVESREFAPGTSFATPFALGGEIRNFSTESRWTTAGHISGIIRLYDAAGNTVLEKTVSARETTGAGGGILTGPEDLQDTMNQTLAEFVRKIVSDAELVGRLGGDPKTQAAPSKGDPVGVGERFQVVPGSSGALNPVAATAKPQILKGTPEPQAPQVVPVSPTATLQEELAHLDRLKAQGTLTPDEYAAIRRRLIEAFNPSAVAPATSPRAAPPTPASPPASAPVAPSPAGVEHVWILGVWESFPGTGGITDGVARFEFSRDAGRIRWKMSRTGWVGGVKTAQEASGTVVDLSESSADLKGKYQVSNPGNLVGQPLQQALTRRSDMLQGYEFRNDGGQWPVVLKRVR